MSEGFLGEQESEKEIEKETWGHGHELEFKVRPITTVVFFSSFVWAQSRWNV